MPIVENMPDLSHWRTVQEFNITQAALLLSGIDPYDYSSLEDVRDKHHERWKMAWGFSDGMVSAMRRGVLTPIVCIGEVMDWRGEYGYIEIKATDRTHDICKDKTIVTRDSLFEWGKKERIDFARRPRPIKNTSQVQPEISCGIVTDTTSELVNENSPRLLTYGHKSEGLEFVQDAIKELWSTYDEDDPQTAPTKEMVINYLKQRGAGKNMAEAVNLILRPAHLHHVGRRARKTDR
ncbi:TPA: hypothetical protein PXP53_000696 [Yersinia enterocolitica]|nr:hypothetical protein [Yersinia enterocolitica]